MRILLVGATGRLGAAVGEAPTGRGHEIVTVGRTAGDVQADVADPEQTARDIITEVAITTDGDESLFVGSDEVEFLAPVRTGDFPDRPPDPRTPLVRWPRPIAFPADCPAPPRGAAAPPRGGRGAGEGRTDDTRLRSPGRH
jgi:hypothetical protein